MTQASGNFANGPCFGSMVGLILAYWHTSQYSLIHNSLEKRISRVIFALLGCPVSQLHVGMFTIDIH